MNKLPVEYHSQLSKTSGFCSAENGRKKYGIASPRPVPGLERRTLERDMVLADIRLLDRLRLLQLQTQLRRGALD